MVWTFRDVDVLAASAEHAFRDIQQALDVFVQTELLQDVESVFELGEAEFDIVGEDSQPDAGRRNSVCEELCSFLQVVLGDCVPDSAEADNVVHLREDALHLVDIAGAKFWNRRDGLG